MRLSPLNLFTIVLLLVSSVALLALSTYRATTFPFTHDESVSFAIFSWQPVYEKTANNHLLNTFLMRQFSYLFGNSELALRLPTLLAQALYLGCGIALSMRLQNVWMQVSSFAMLNLNPFLLDFFFLARGYGLALGFLMLSLLLYARALHEKKKPIFVLFAYLSTAAGALAVLANFSFLNFYLPLLAACTLLLVTDESLRNFTTQHILSTLGMLIVNCAYLGFVALKTFDLQQRGELYFGGHDGFISDTLASLVHSSLYFASYPQISTGQISGFVIGIFFISLVYGIFLWFRKANQPLFLFYLFILTISIVLPLVQHQALGTLFPIERAALYYLPLFALTFTAALDLAVQQLGRDLLRALVLLVPIAVAVLLSWHLYHTLNIDTTYTWNYDAHDKEVIELINRDHAAHSPNSKVRLGVTWLMEPSLNFYRVTRNYTWLAPVTRDPLNSAPFDYIYASKTDLKAIQFPLATTLAEYADTDTILLATHQPAQ